MSASPLDRLKAGDRWNQIQNHYGTISPSQVFYLIKQAINFCLDGSTHPRPQLECLEAIHTDLATNQAELLEFVQSMILLSRLPPAWETSIIQTIMAGGQVTGITWALMTQTIIKYWDADQAKSVTGLGAASRAGTHVSCATRQESVCVSVYKSGITPV
jgi:hypothetical protein